MVSLSEFESKKLLHGYGLRTTKEFLVSSPNEALEVAKKFGYPVVAKLCDEGIFHKTEINGVRLNIQNSDELLAAIQELELLGDGNSDYLIAEQINGSREFIAGYHIDKDFGPVLMFGLGGIFAEVLADVNFRLLPTSRDEILTMAKDLSGRALLEAFRGEEAVSIQDLVESLEAIAQCGLDNPSIISIDVNPLIISNTKPIAVDALVIQS